MKDVYAAMLRPTGRQMDILQKESLILHLLGNKCKYSVNVDTSHSACEIAHRNYI